MSLRDWGWSASLATHLADGDTPCRVIASHSNLARVVTEAGEFTVPVAGLRPATGDWAVLRGGRLTRILPRRTWVSRKRAGEASEEQVLAANVDVLFRVLSASVRDQEAGPLIPSKVGGDQWKYRGS